LNIKSASALSSQITEQWQKQSARARHVLQDLMVENR